MNIYRSIDSSWDHSDTIFLAEGQDIVPIRVENDKHKYTIYVSEKTIACKNVFTTILSNVGFTGQISVQLPDGGEVYYGWAQNNKLHREDGPAFIKMSSLEGPVLAVQWLLNGTFDTSINNYLVGIDRLALSLKFFYRIGLEKFQIIRSDRSSSEVETAPMGLKEVINKHSEIDFKTWDTLLNTYNPNL